MRFFNVRNCLWLTILTVLLLNCGGCGEGTDKPALLVSGTLAFDASLRKGDAPVLVAVISTLDNRQIQENPRDAIIRYAAAGGNGKTFEIDLSDTWLKAGDRVSLIAFIDNNYKGGVPFPDAGDAIGVYVASGSLTPGFDLYPGGNTGMHIDIDRAVFDYEASISGTITGNDTGEVIVVAYAGDIVSSDFSGLDTGSVMGFERIEKGAGPVSYTLDILPYGRDVPIENLQVFALLDANANNEIDAGDRIGFYGRGDAYATLLTLTDNAALTGIDLEFKFDVRAHSGDEVAVSGDIALPASYEPDQGHLYLFVFDGSDTAAIGDDFFSSIRYFKRLPSGSVEYAVDLSETGLGFGDQVMVAGLWDKDFAGGFPALTVGDHIGICFESGRLSPSFELAEGGNSGMDIHIDRAVFDYEASISGTITGNDIGDVIVVAYAGDMVSSDFSGLDIGSVMGFERIEKGAGPVSYTLDILPYGRDVPIENVQVFALLDANANNEIDAGDRIGFYGRGGAVSSPLVIDQGMNIEDIDLVFRIDIPEPSGLDMSIAGTFSVPADFLRGDAPVFITVFDADNPGDILDEPDRMLKYFYKMPPYEIYFNRDLSHTDLVPGDRVMIAALWDRDFAGGFPEPTRGDKLGIVVNKNTYQLLTELSHGRTIIPPLDHEFKINKHIYDFSASIDYALDMSEAGSFNVEKGRLIVLAVHVEGVKLCVSFSGEITLDIDMDYMLAVDIVPATEYDHIGIGERQDPYSPRNLSILTALFEQVVVWEANRPTDPLIKGENHGEESERTAFLIAILDKNGNGALDRGDEIGYYGAVATEVVAGILIDELPKGLKIFIPEGYSGTLYLPAPIQRIVVGRNQEQRNDGTTGPFWIGHFTRVP